MNHIKSYDAFKESRTNEGLMDVLKAATGAFKNFLGGITTPFKNIKDDFKKLKSFEEIKGRFNKSIDDILVNATTNINKAKDENELNQMVDAFAKEIDEKMQEFDKEIKSIKESKVFEGVQDGLIGGRVLFGILKDEYNKIKVDFDKRFAAAKDLNAKKQARVEELKTIVDNFKKKISDEKFIKDVTAKYRADNKIEGSDGESDLIKSYGAEKKEDLIGKEVRYKTKKYDNNKKPEEQKDQIGKLKVLKVTPDGLIFDGEKEDFEKKMTDILPEVKEGNDTEEITNTLTKIKTDKEKIGLVKNFLTNIEDKEKMKKIQDILK